MTTFQIVISVLCGLILLVYSIALVQVLRLTSRRRKRARARFEIKRARIAKEMDGTARHWGSK